MNIYKKKKLLSYQFWLIFYTILAIRKVKKRTANSRLLKT